jgi:hypothetical protein
VFSKEIEMGVKYIENTGRNVLFVGGKMIPPGEGREVDERLLPPELRDPAPEPAAPAEPSIAQLLVELLKGSVKVVVAKLPELSGDALAMVEAIEAGDGTPRKTVLEAVRAEQLRRAESAMEADAKAKADEAAFQAEIEAAYQKQLATLSADELAAIGEEGKARLRDQAELEALADRAERGAGV